MLFNFKSLVILLASVFLVNSLNTINFPNDLYLVEADGEHKPIGGLDEYILEDRNPPENIFNREILPSSELYSLPKEVHDQQTPIRFRRSPADEGKNGNVNVDVSRTRDQGTNIHVDANRDVWKSQDGRSKVEASGHYDRNVGGRQHGQPRENYGGRVSFSHRWRRSTADEGKDRNVNVDVSSTRDEGSNIHIDASRNLWRSHDGRTSVEVGGHYDRNVGGRQSGQPREDYGGFATLSHRWKQSPDEGKTGNVNVDLSSTRQQGTNVRLDVNRDLWRSHDGRTSFETSGFYDRNIGDRQPGQPRADYGGFATLSHRWRRSPDEGKNGDVNVDVSRTRDQGTNIHVDASRDVWKSHDGRTRVEAGGHYDRNIGGRQPGQPREDYGGHVRFSHRFRRSPQFTPPFNPQGGFGNPQGGFGNPNPGFGSPNGPHGNVNIGVEHQQGRGMQLHLGANQDLWRSRNGMTSFGGSAFYDRNFGRTFPGMPRDNYGAQIQFNHRF